MEDNANVHTRQSVVNEQRIRRFQPNRKMNQVHFLHDKFRPHTCLHTRDEIAAVVCTAVRHHPYSPHLAWCDFHLICHLKDCPQVRRWHPFADDDELKHSLREEFQHFSEEVYTYGIQTVTLKWKKCVDSAKEFVDKQSQPWKACTNNISSFTTIIIMVSD
jgi:hypothetical protein